MSEYTLVAAVFLAVAVILGAVRGLFRRHSVWIGLAIFIVLTIAVDVVLTRLGVYVHRAAFNAGILIDQMPIEDLLYGIALYLVAIVSWSWSPRHSKRGRVNVGAGIDAQ